MPSALALISSHSVDIPLLCRQWAQRGRAMACATILLTSFEVYRAGMACRVDMLLTFFMVGALFTLYNYWKRGMHGFPVAPVLMMSGAMLSKGACRGCCSRVPWPDCSCWSGGIFLESLFKTSRYCHCIVCYSDDMVCRSLCTWRRGIPPVLRLRRISDALREQ